MTTSCDRRKTVSNHPQRWHTLVETKRFIAKRFEEIKPSNSPVPCFVHDSPRTQQAEFCQSLSTQHPEEHPHQPVHKFTKHAFTETGNHVAR